MGQIHVLDQAACFCTHLQNTNFSFGCFVSVYIFLKSDREVQVFII